MPLVHRDGQRGAVCDATLAAKAAPEPVERHHEAVRDPVALYQQLSHPLQVRGVGRNLRPSVRHELDRGCDPGAVPLEARHTEIPAGKTGRQVESTSLDGRSVAWVVIAFSFQSTALKRTGPAWHVKRVPSRLPLISTVNWPVMAARVTRPDTRYSTETAPS